MILLVKWALVNMWLLTCRGRWRRGKRLEPWTHCEYFPKISDLQEPRPTLILNDRFSFIDFLPIIQKTPEFFQKSNYKNPGDPNGGPLQYAYNTTESCWDWLAKNPDALGRFNTFMEGGRDDTSHWADWFPVQERLLDRSSPDRPLLVDVGGGRGHDLEGFKQRFPVEAGKLVLEDLPSVIDDIQHLDHGIQRIKHSFFEPQPVKGLWYSCSVHQLSNRYHRCSRLLL